MSAAAIRVAGVDKAYGRGRHRTRALSGIDCEIPAGAVTGLIGPNGAGKSTLLHVILDLVRPDAGSVEIFGRPASDPRSREGIGFLPEEVGYEAALRVREVLTVHGRLTGADASGALADVGLTVRPSQRIGRCSLGTARRIALACALTGRPRLLILDEPTSGMDVPSRRALLARLRRFADAGGTVLVSSHVLSELEEICSRYVLLGDGRVADTGAVRRGEPLEALFDAPDES